ncbi:MAG: hypothetical protein LBM08_05670 [Dysgonamonadaceae bacterium]|jgi:hypothetical protein|nr:hypothetical protein [Dysgonamonadaceae bacterium]
MKKTVFVLMSLLILASGMLGCDKEEKEETPDNACGIINISNDEYVTMQASPENVSINADSIHLIIENHTKENIICDAVFSLDYHDGQTWIPVNLNISFEDIGYILKSGESMEQVLVLLFPEYNIVRGKYRVKKHITLTDSSTKEYTICAEFEIYF